MPLLAIFNQNFTFKDNLNMKKHITQDIFDTAATLPAKEGVAAIEQLLIEASSLYTGVSPDGFSYSVNTSSIDKQGNYFLTTKTPHPSSKIDKLLTGMGVTPELAFIDLVAEMDEWFAAYPPTTPDLRTEIAA